MLGVNESQSTGQPPLGRLPFQPLPRLENQTVLGEPEITPFAAERRGGGAGAKAGRAGRGVERATFTGPGGFTLAELGGLAPGVVYRDPRYPP